MISMNFLSNFFEFVFWQEKSTWSTFTGYFSCFFQIKSTFWHKIQKIDFNFVFWQVKSNKYICIWVLTGKIQQIDLNFCFDMKVQINLFEFVFWQRKSIWSIITGYLSIFLIKFAFWQEKSRKLSWFLCFDR